jgi:GT2 family glycosyltransferase
MLTYLNIQDKLGLRVLWTPYAELYHDEMKSRGYDDTPDRQARLKAETLYLQNRWRERLMNDPAYSPNLTIEADNFSLAFPSRRSHALNRFYGNRLLDIVDRKVPNLDKISWLNYALNHFLPTSSLPQIEINEPIDIIIPIFNGYEYLTVLIPAIINHTTLPYRVILFDDASTDQRVVTYLREIQENHSQFLYIRAEKNLGFVGAVNHAYKSVKSHFVLLNQDTEVPPQWLERLMYPIVTNPSTIASTTPFTNAGTICSFPNFLQDNPIFNNLKVIELDQFFQQVKITDNYVEIPTGVGFCMGMNKTVVEQVGLFNEQLFGRGYGEENDWCMRAKKAGYKNIIVPNLFVYHKHGGVFSSPEKEQLKRDNFAKQVRLHPEYPGLVEDFIKRDPLKVLRESLIIRISAASAATGAVLIIDHDIGGGANIFRKKILGEWVTQGTSVFLLTYNNSFNIFKLFFQKDSYQFEYKFESFIEIQKLFSLVRISEVHVNDVVTLEKPLEIVSIVTLLKKNFDSYLVFYLHDYFSICPSYVLINDKGVYCEVPAHLETCQNCLANNFGEFRGFVERESIDIIKWRAVWGDFLAVADKIVGFSNSSKEILRTAYPSLPEEKIIVSPHQVEGFFPLKFVPERGTLHIGVVGAMNIHKGMEILKQMAKLLEEKNYDARIIIIGQASEAISSDKLIVTGEYKREELPVLIKKHHIGVVFIPSIWPETFSFTTEEIIMMELPLAVFDIGAPPERVKGYKKGLVIEKIDAAYALEELLKFSQSG